MRNVPRIYIQAARALGAEQDHIWSSFVPELMLVALALAFGLFAAGRAGIGFMIMVARRSLNTQTILLGIIIIGISSAAILLHPS